MGPSASRNNWPFDIHVLPALTHAPETRRQADLSHVQKSFWI